MVNLVILLVIRVVRVYCCRQKMLKETETAETIGFLVTFLSLVAFQLREGGARALCSPTPGYAYGSRRFAYPSSTEIQTAVGA